MKKLMLLVLFTGIMNSQNKKRDYIYTNASFDVNMAFGIIDNVNTLEFDDRGFDFDIEAGVIWNRFGVYVFYGRFEPLSYQNYGAGVDYYFNFLSNNNVHLYNPFSGKRFKIIEGIDFSLGIAYGVVIREKNHGYNGHHIRGVTTFWITDRIGLTGRFQFTMAGDLPNKDFRKEGSIGITYKLTNN